MRPGLADSALVAALDAGLFLAPALGEARTASLTRVLLEDPRSGKVFLEPPPAARLGQSDSKLRL